jgi:aminoglycoside phosphotransferase (APT) family kinase protein
LTGPLEGRLEGPLKGHHNVAYAVRLDPSSELGRRFPWLKLREPRAHIFWYDLRCFACEEDLLADLQGRVPRIPQVVRIESDPSVRLIEFIEGETLGTRHRPGTPIRGLHLRQLGEVFRGLTAVDVTALPHERVPGHLRHAGPVRGDDSGGFLARLIAHTDDHVHRPHRAEFGALFDAFGVAETALGAFAARVPALTARPYRLLHGDLHRENLIVDRAGDLWTIDWELARIGDPVYELATHLHLMRYPPEQERRVADIWYQSVKAVCPAAVEGALDDLPHYLAYKRAQSVYTDVLRGAASLVAAGEPAPALVRHVASGVREALLRAREALRVKDVGTLDAVADVLTGWLRRR